MQLILFSTSACHLCEQANEILGRFLVHFPKIRLELIDIAEQTQWQAQYAVKIPVLYDVSTQSELNWPFNETDVTTFIHKLNHD
ncbi:MAG: glutaredoxin family protein [Methylococcales bacterium]|nr:glutaredoxin family protein [Methylococcales bacterium]